MFSTRSYEGVLDAAHRDLLNPLDKNALFKGGDMFGAMDKVQSHDGGTQGSGSGSGLSDLSALENETDEFGRLLMQHHRDEQRMSNAVRNNQPFRKARPRPRVAEQILREERERELRESQDQQRAGSSGSNESDPPVTVPREWGRKARPQRNWMKKIIEPSEVDENGNVEETLKPDEDAIYQHRTSYTGDLDWRVTREEALASIETTPPSMRRQRHSTAATPSSMRHMNTTLRPSTNSDDGDFSSASLLASTPAPARLPRKIDELTRREIEDIERQGLTTRALDEIDSKSPNGTLRRTSSTALRERAIAEGMSSSPQRWSRPVTAPAKAGSPSRIPRRRHSPVNNKENVPLNGEVNGRTITEEPMPTTEDLKGQALGIKNPQRARHQRNDSMNLLRKLARVSSMSPSPARSKPDVEAPKRKAETAAQNEIGLLSLKNQSSGDVADAETAPKEPATALKVEEAWSKDPEPPTKEAKKAGWGFGGLFSGRTGQGRDDDRGTEAKPQDINNDADESGSKTPILAIGRVDSTAPNSEASGAEVTEAAKQPKLAATQDTGIAEKTDEKHNALKGTESAPTNPKSALDAIMRETRTAQDDLQFGESTIQSLEDIVNPNLDPTDPTITFDFDPAQAAVQNVDNGEPLTQEQKDQRQEELAIEGLNKHLRAARTSIKDASRGLRRVENRIEAAQEGQPAQAANTTVLVRPRTDRNGFTHCSVCGGGYHSAWYALWAEFRSLFYSWDPKARFGITFTWLGAWCLGWLIWYVVESTMCSFYCTPRYAVPGTKFPGPGYSVPRFPWTIPMVIFSPFKKYWLPTLNAFEDGLMAYWHEMTGPIHFSAMPAPKVERAFRPLTKKFAKTVPMNGEWVAAATATGVRVAQSVMDAVDEVGSMWDDEFLS